MIDAQASDGKMIPHIAGADPHIPNPLRLGEHPKKHRCQPAFGVKRVRPSHFRSIRIVFKPPLALGKFRDVAQGERIVAGPIGEILGARVRRHLFAGGIAIRQMHVEPTGDGPMAPCFPV